MYKVTSNNLKNEGNWPFIYFFRKKLRKMFVVKKKCVPLQCNSEMMTQTNWDMV